MGSYIVQGFNRESTTMKHKKPQSKKTNKQTKTQGGLWGIVESLCGEIKVVSASGASGRWQLSNAEEVVPRGCRGQPSPSWLIPACPAKAPRALSGWWAHSCLPWWLIKSQRSSLWVHKLLCHTHKLHIFCCACLQGGVTTRCLCLVGGEEAMTGAWRVWRAELCRVPRFSVSPSARNVSCGNRESSASALLSIWLPASVRTAQDNCEHPADLSELPHLRGVHCEN